MGKENETRVLSIEHLVLPYEGIEASFDRLNFAEVQYDSYINGYNFPCQIEKCDHEQLQALIDSILEGSINKLFHFEHTPRDQDVVGQALQDAYRMGVRFVDALNFGSVNFRVGHLLRERETLRWEGYYFVNRSKTSKWIVLQASNISDLIKSEQSAYNDYIQKFVQQHGDVLVDVQEVKKNLALLEPVARCAQTIIHEYGHHLQHLAMRHSQIDSDDDQAQLDWYLQSGYLYNVFQRYFKMLETEPNERTLLYFVKESFVEDYRIGQQRKNRAGSEYFLPNSVSFRGDFVKPSLLEEGVRIVDEMLRGIQGSERSDQKGLQNDVSGEEDRVALINQPGIDLNRYNQERSFSDFFAAVKAKSTTESQTASVMHTETMELRNCIAGWDARELTSDEINEALRKIMSTYKEHSDAVRKYEALRFPLSAALFSRKPKNVFEFEEKSGKAWAAVTSFRRLLSRIGLVAPVDQTNEYERYFREFKSTNPEEADVLFQLACMELNK